MALSVRFMPSKHKDLSLPSRTCVKKLGMVTRAGDPSAREVEMGRFLGFTGQPA